MVFSRKHSLLLLIGLFLSFSSSFSAELSREEIVERADLPSTSKIADALLTIQSSLNRGLPGSNYGTEVFLRDFLRDRERVHLNFVQNSAYNNDIGRNRSSRIERRFEKGRWVDKQVSSETLSGMDLIPDLETRTPYDYYLTLDEKDAHLAHNLAMTYQEMHTENVIYEHLFEREEESIHNSLGREAIEQIVRNKVLMRAGQRPQYALNREQISGIIRSAALGYFRKMKALKVSQVMERGGAGKSPFSQHLKTEKEMSAEVVKDLYLGSELRGSLRLGDIERVFLKLIQDSEYDIKEYSSRLNKLFNEMGYDMVENLIQRNSYLSAMISFERFVEEDRFPPRARRVPSEDRRRSDTRYPRRDSRRVHRDSDYKHSRNPKIRLNFGFRYNTSL